MRLWLERHASPIGPMLSAVDAQGVLLALDFEDCEARMHRLLRLNHGHHGHHGAGLCEGRPSNKSVGAALEAYFGGSPAALSGLPLRTAGTALQQAVWSALRLIPVGSTVSYGELAVRLGRPGASRAVGRANGANPIAIAVPCHRVIGRDGTLTGYAGGLQRKQWLLAHERQLAGGRLPE